MELKRIDISEISELDYGDGMIAFGAFEDDRLLGFIAFTPTENMPGVLSLRHIYVRESYRNMGLGSDMLNGSAKALGILENITGISSCFRTYDLSGKAGGDGYYDPAAITSFLESNGFVRTPVRQTIVRYRISDLFESKFGQKLEEMKKICGPVLGLDNLSQRQLIKYQEQLKQRNMNISYKGLDLKYSEFYLKDDTVYGFFLTENKGGTIDIIDYFVSEDTEEKYIIPGLLGRLLMTVGDLDRGKDIMMTIAGEKTLAAIESVLGPNHRYGSRTEYIRFV